MKDKRLKRDLTQGSIIKNIWSLAIPMIVANMLQTTFNIVDMFWVGKLGSEAIAAVAICGTVLMVVMTLLIGIATGTLALVSRFIGAQDVENAGDVAMQSLILALIGSLFVAAVGYVITPDLIRLIGAEPQVLSLATGYMRISLVGIVTMFLLFIISAILRGAGDAITPMLIISGAAIVNIVIDPLLIFGIGFPRMGVNGAALATVFARGIGAIVGLWVMFKGYSFIKLKLSSFRIIIDVIRRILKIGIPSTLEMGFRSLVGVVLMGIVARYGTYAITAYGVGIRILMVVLMPGFGLASAAAILVGQNLGAQRPQRAQASAWTAARLYMLIMGLAGIIFFILARHIIYIFDSHLEVVDLGSSFLRVIAPGLIFLALGLVLGKSLGGAGDTIPPMVITLITMWGLQIPLALILPNLLQIGVIGIWWTILAIHIIHGVMVTGWFQLGRWKTKLV